MAARLGSGRDARLVGPCSHQGAHPGCQHDDDQTGEQQDAKDRPDQDHQGFDQTEEDGDERGDKDEHGETPVGWMVTFDVSIGPACVRF